MYSRFQAQRNRISSGSKSFTGFEYRLQNFDHRSSMCLKSCDGRIGVNMHQLQTSLECKVSFSCCRSQLMCEEYWLMLLGLSLVSFFLFYEQCRPSASHRISSCIHTWTTQEKLKPARYQGIGYENSMPGIALCSRDSASCRQRSQYSLQNVQYDRA